MWRRVIDIALDCSLLVFVSAYAVAWINRGSPIMGWVAAAFWAGLASMPLLFLLALVKMADWYSRLGSGGSRSKASRAARMPDGSSAEAFMVNVTSATSASNTTSVLMAAR